MRSSKPHSAATYGVGLFPGVGPPGAGRSAAVDGGTSTTSPPSGQAGYEKYRREFAKLIWRTASPEWAFDDAAFHRTAAAFENRDHVAVVVHNYRWRLGSAGEAQRDELEKRLADTPPIGVPTIALEGDANGASHPERSAYANKFTGSYAHRTIGPGIGHHLPHEAPQAFAEAVIDTDRY